MGAPCNCPDSNPCGQVTPCIEPNCACDVFLDSKCITNISVDTPCVNIPKGLPFNEWMPAFANAMCAKIVGVASNFSLRNTLGGLGTGTLYKGIALTGEKEIKRIKAGTLITVNNLIDDVEVAVDTVALAALAPTATNVGTGLGEVFKNKVLNNFNFRRIKTENTGILGANILKAEATDLINDNVVISARKIKTQSLGIGTPIVNTEIESLNDITIPVKSIKTENTGNTGITILDTQTIFPNNIDTVTISAAKLDTQTLDIKKVNGVITIDIPSTFVGTDYYVNSNYDPSNLGLPETGTASKPFRSLKSCLDKILNRPFTLVSNTDGIIHPNPLINGGLPYDKWNPRGTANEGAVRVIIQSYTTTEENLAVNRVEYFLEKEGFNSMIEVLGNVNLPYIFDMESLAVGVPKNGLGQLPYEINCKLSGVGNIAFNKDNTFRKGFVKAFGFFSGGNQSIEQHDCFFTLGSKNSNMLFLMEKNPSLPYSLLTSSTTESIPIVREGVQMTGILETDTVQTNYGAIHVSGRNAIFAESLFLSGNLSIKAIEQPIIMCENGGSAYGGEGVIQIQRNYQHIHYSATATIGTRNTYLPSKKINDIYLKNGGRFIYAGEITSQQNTGATEGGANTFVKLERTTTNLNDACGLKLTSSKITNLYYNHYIQIVYETTDSLNANHGVNLANCLFNSTLHANSAINVIALNGSNITSVSGITVVNSFMNLIQRTNTILANICNLPVNSIFYITGGTLNTDVGFINSVVPGYADNATAIAGGASVFSFYVDNNGFVKRVF
jgi:hypothetical protein